VVRCALTGGNPDSNTLISDMTTVICLDDYHSLDRSGRKKESVTALDPKAQNFDLMYEQIKDLKDGKTVAKPIYNHVSGLLDPPEDTSAAKVCWYCMTHSCLCLAVLVGKHRRASSACIPCHNGKHTIFWSGLFPCSY